MKRCDSGCHGGVRVVARERWLGWKRRTAPKSGSARGQANLPVVAVALIVLMAVTGMTVAMAEGAVLSAERDADERALAVATANAFVDGDADHTRRANVLDAEALAEIQADGEWPAGAVDDDAAVRISASERVVLERGDPDGGTTVRRLAKLASDEEWIGSVAVGSDEELDVPAGTTALEIEPDGSIEAVRVDGRVVVDGTHGPEGTTDVTLRPERNATVTASGDHGRVAVTARRERTEPVVVEVTLDG